MLVCFVGKLDYTEWIKVVIVGLSWNDNRRQNQKVSSQLVMTKYLQTQPRPKDHGRTFSPQLCWYKNQTDKRWQNILENTNKFSQYQSSQRTRHRKLHLRSTSNKKGERFTNRQLFHVSFKLSASLAESV